MTDDPEGWDAATPAGEPAMLCKVYSPPRPGRMVVAVDDGVDPETKRRVEEAFRDLPATAGDDEIRAAFQRAGWDVRW